MTTIGGRLLSLITITSPGRSRNDHHQGLKTTNLTVGLKELEIRQPDLQTTRHISYTSITYVHAYFTMIITYVMIIVGPCSEHKIPYRGAASRYLRFIAYVMLSTISLLFSMHYSSSSLFVLLSL